MAPVSRRWQTDTPLPPHESPCLLHSHHKLKSYAQPWSSSSHIWCRLNAAGGKGITGPPAPKNPCRMSIIYRLESILSIPNKCVFILTTLFYVDYRIRQTLT